MEIKETVEVITTVKHRIDLTTEELDVLLSEWFTQRTGCATNQVVVDFDVSSQGFMRGVSITYASSTTELKDIK